MITVPSGRLDSQAELYIFGNIPREVLSWLADGLADFGREPLQPTLPISSPMFAGVPVLLAAWRESRYEGHLEESLWDPG
jgi:hypothetical protein